MSIATEPLSLTINGKAVGPLQVPANLMMIDFLHEYLDLTGARLGCGQGICHACVVILDKPDGTSEEIRTCITGALFFQLAHPAPRGADAPARGARGATRCRHPAPVGGARARGRPHRRPCRGPGIHPGAHHRGIRHDGTAASSRAVTLRP